MIVNIHVLPVIILESMMRKEQRIRVLEHCHQNTLEFMNIVLSSDTPIDTTNWYVNYREEEIPLHHTTDKSLGYYQTIDGTPFCPIETEFNSVWKSKPNSKKVDLTKFIVGDATNNKNENIPLYFFDGRYYA
jgi:hypothetical protein